jgi:hypothetical protein
MIISLALLLLGSAHSCFALLEERFVGFEDSDGALNIADATIVYDAQDPKAVQIAVSSLSEDWGQITGTEAPLRRLASNDTIGSPGISRAIIAATVDSDLIGRLEERDKIDVSDIRGKWESFKTFVVSEPIEGVDDAFVIAGSDKRGTAFGVYTLSEQSGQSPYAHARHRNSSSITNLLIRNIFLQTPFLGRRASSQA